jgi:hypothetical protein
LGKELAMTTLPVLLMLEEDRMKRRKRDNASSNLMMAQSSHVTQFKPMRTLPLFSKSEAKTPKLVLSDFGFDLEINW